jgi:hypothetical protein
MDKNQQIELRKAQRLNPEEFDDEADFAARFAFSPRLERLGYAKDKFKHINKNLVLTHLSNSEVDKANRLLLAIQTLMNHNETKYYKVVNTGSGEEKKEVPKSRALDLYEQGYLVLTETTNRWQDLLDVKTGELFGMTSTASGAGASLLKEWRSQRMKQEQTIREEQEPSQWFGRLSQRNKKRNSGRR